MKTLVVGAGSIGRRHVLMARELGWEVALAETDRDRASQVAGEAGEVAVFETIEDSLAWGPETAIIATPHVHHVAHAKACAQAGVDILIEKPVSHSLDEADDLVATVTRCGRKAFVVCNMRFHPAIDAIAGNIDRLGAVYYARSHYGDYLPSFRPDRDYRELYCAKRAEGGGVVLDAAIHELDLLIWLFGPVKRLQGMAAKLSHLEMDAEDFCTMALEHEAGVRSVITFDYFRRWRRRGIELVGEKGQIVWESEGNVPEHAQVRLYDGEAGRWETLYESSDVDNATMYRDCLSAFAMAVAGKQSKMQTLSEARERLDVALRARDQVAWN